MEHIERAKSSELVNKILHKGLHKAWALLAKESDEIVASVLASLPTGKAVALLPRFDAVRRTAILKLATLEQREAWLYNQHYPKGSVGRLMEPVIALFAPTVTVREAVGSLRAMVKEAFVSYGYVVDEENCLLGALVMRDLLLAQPHQAVHEVMIEHPFTLEVLQQVSDVIPLVHIHHYPEYPVCDDTGHIIGIVRGYALFQEQTLRLAAQPSKMVGIEQEEHILTAPLRSLRMRHPWLQANLLSSFLAAGIMGFYETTIVEAVAVAAFVPVMVGQSASTGGQALAVALRGLTLGEFVKEDWRSLINKEALVGIGNGILVGATAALGIYVYASYHGHVGGKWLAVAMLLAMIVSTMVSGVVGAVMPFIMKRMGFDPATAATIIVGGVTRIVSIVAFLALARWILL